MARLISLVEDASPKLREVAAALSPHTGHAQVIGLTGSPGVGKSTTTTALVRSFRKAGKRVGVLAVDPSSPVSGGALLGDRVRMQDHALDRDVSRRPPTARAGRAFRDQPQLLGTRTISASPWPPPPHSAAAPTPPPRRLSSRAR